MDVGIRFSKSDGLMKLDPNYWVLRAVLRSGNGDF